jgi:hypothetical protein
MRAGKMIIANYSNKAIDLLLPELEKGMLDSAWRIRVSFVVSLLDPQLTLSSNPRSPLLVNYSTELQVSAGKSNSRRTKHQLILPTTLERPCSMPWVQRGGTGSWQRCISCDRMLWVLSGKLRYIFGRRWYRVSRIKINVRKANDCRHAAYDKGDSARTHAVTHVVTG